MPQRSFSLQQSPEHSITFARLLSDGARTSYEDYTSQDIVAKVMEITDGAGCKAVIDGIGLATYEISLACTGQVCPQRRNTWTALGAERMALITSTAQFFLLNATKRFT